jgi:hypothetical protein
MEGRGSGLRHYPSIYPYGVRKPERFLTQDSRDLNPGTPEYEAEE